MANVNMPKVAEEYPNNSISSRQKAEEHAKVEPVVKGSVTKQKPSLGSRFKKTFMPGDIREAKKYVLEQVLIPGLKNGALAAVEMIFFGQVTNRFSQRNTNRNNATNYSYISSNGVRVESRPQQISRTQRESFSFQNISFESFDDASDVVESLMDILEREGVVCVGDFYSLCGIQTEPTDYDWGWKTFKRLEPRRLREGYTIDMTPPVYLGR